MEVVHPHCTVRSAIHGLIMDVEQATSTTPATLGERELCLMKLKAEYQN